MLKVDEAEETSFMYLIHIDAIKTDAVHLFEQFIRETEQFMGDD